MDWKHIRREAIAGVTTFLTMAYIIVVNPTILSAPGTGMSFSGVMTATVLLAFFSTLFMGLYAQLPFGVAPGMGINAFFTYSLILGQHLPWATALGLVFWAGVLFLILSILPVRLAIAEAIPDGLRQASAVGIGLFLTFIGLQKAGIVVADPVTFVRLGSFDRKVMLSLLGLLIMAVGLTRRSRLAFIGGILGVTAVAWGLGLITLPTEIVSPPDFQSHLFRLDWKAALNLALLPAIVAICFTDLFDSLSTFMGIAHATGMVDDTGRPLRLKQGLVVDAVATLTAGLFGTSSGTAYIESASGIEAGGRTGLTAVFCALCFLPFLFLSPLVNIVPAYATAPVLILVGGMMFRTVSKLNMGSWEDLIPRYLTIVLIPLTFSITQGMLWGFTAHAVLYTLAGRGREISKMMWGIAALSIGLLWLGH